MSHTGATAANPAPLGLFGFALTTILLNIHNAGFFGLDVMIMAMGLFYGGIAQLIAGIMEYRQGNTFGTVAFVSYGAFWISLVFIWVAPKFGLPAVDPVSLGCYLGIWGLLSFAMFICTLRGKTIGKLIFGTLVVLFFLLAAANFTGSHSLHVIAGYEGILCGALAFYEAAALLINEKYGCTVLPM